MALVNTGNQATIDGNKNIVIQGTQGGTFNIQPLDVTQLGNKLREMLGLNTSISVIVLTTDLPHLRSNPTLQLPFAMSEIEQHYGNTPSDWKPFSDDATILEILKEFGERSEINVQPIFMDWKDLDLGRDERLTITGRRSNLILIADIFALNFRGNESLARLFDVPEVGGCLLPICATLNSTVLDYAHQKVVDIFSDLGDFTKKYSNFVEDCQINKGFLQFDAHISDKNSFFRRLIQIAIYCQKINKGFKLPSLPEIPSEIPNL